MKRFKEDASGTAAVSLLIHYPHGSVPRAKRVFQSITLALTLTLKLTLTLLKVKFDAIIPVNSALLPRSRKLAYNH